MNEQRNQWIEKQNEKDGRIHRGTGYENIKYISMVFPYAVPHGPSNGKTDRDMPGNGRYIDVEWGYRMEGEGGTE